MLKNKRFNKHFKKAQQIVELALVLPFFIICFSFVFQLMVETYAKYKFSYIFTNAIARAIELQQENVYNNPITNYNNVDDYNFRSEVGRITKAAMIGVPNNGIQISDLQTNGVNNYLSGIFITDVRRIFFKSTGLEYFYFIVPINRIYFKTMVLNVSNDDYKFFSDWYFHILALLYQPASIETPPAESGSTPSGGESETGSGSETGGSGAEAGSIEAPIPTESSESAPLEENEENPSFGESAPLWGEAEAGG